MADITFEFSFSKLSIKKNPELVIIDSNYGHDGFMVEPVKISKHFLHG